MLAKHVKQRRKELLFIRKGCTRCNQLSTAFLVIIVFKGEEGHGQVAGCLLDGECDIYHPQ
jgi:hypothetical protein